jgi:hemerythrin
MKINWDDSFSVGVNAIDQQHKKLIERFNHMALSVENHREAHEISLTLDFMIEYTDYHFSTEEKHMNKLGYPGLEAHHTEHENFKDVLNNLLGDFEEEGATRTLAESINNFMGNWLVNHIKGTDQEFGKFLCDKGLSSISME